MIWKITGGVAEQPNIPQVQFGWGRNDGWFEAELAYETSRIISSPSLTNETEFDRIYEVASAGVYAQDYMIKIQTEPRPNGSPFPDISITNNGGVTLDGLRLMSSQNNVVDTVTLTTPQRTIELQARGIIGSIEDTIRIFKEFTDGSLAKHCDESITTRIQNATSSMKPIYVNYSSSNLSGIYTRNPNCWVYDLSQSMTCISPWNSNGKNTKAGVAITPRHIVNAAHYQFPVGTVIRFVTADNQTITRTVIDKQVHPEFTPFIYDIAIYLLDSDLPDSIVPCKVLPQNFLEYIPTRPQYIGALALDQEEKALVTDTSLFTDRIIAFSTPRNSQPDKVSLYENIIVGDSGNPAFFIINNELVLLTVWTGGGAGVGTFVATQIDIMNQMILDLDISAGINTGYTIQTVDLSGFTNFS